MHTWLPSFLYVQEYIMLLYASVGYGSYLLFALVAIHQLWKYKRAHHFVNYQLILSSPLAPRITLIAPAYNEQLSIVLNVRSLLALRYARYELIIVNDGSSDATLEQLIRSFSLKKFDMTLPVHLKTNQVRGVYRSDRKAYRNLLVIDKVNGGKADALNAGLNLASGQYVACVDVDCILEKDALLKLVKPFLDQQDVVATGGVIRVANSCEVRDGQIVKVVMPKRLLARFQVLEYLRTFLIGRMAWGAFNGLLLISGALGMFDRRLVMACGGYDKSTVGEDMELTVRMRKYQMDKGKKAKVVYVPDPLCWTEVPETNEGLGKQRSRWSRGTIDTLVTHRRMIFNPVYGIVGMISLPYWLIYEWLAPFIELFSLLVILLAAAFGYFNAQFWLSLFVFVYVFNTLISTMVLLAEETSYFKYSSRLDLLRIFIISLLEPLLYYPLKIYWALRGNYQFCKGEKQWGVLKRAGFNTAQPSMSI